MTTAADGPSPARGLPASALETALHPPARNRWSRDHYAGGSICIPASFCGLVGVKALAG